jgi:hypothetical protein
LFLCVSPFLPFSLLHASTDILNLLANMMNTVCKVTSYSWTPAVRFPIIWGKFYVAITVSKQAAGPTQPPYHWMPAVSRRLDREAAAPVEVKNAYTCLRRLHKMILWHKTIPLHAMQELSGRGNVAPTHFLPRN